MLEPMGMRIVVERLLEFLVSGAQRVERIALRRIFETVRLRYDSEVLEFAEMKTSSLSTKR
jgi:hypothetical protein